MLDTATWKALRAEILQEIVPQADEREQVKNFCLKVEREMTEALKCSGFQAIAKVHGSVARGTWLAGERDFDVFIILENDYGREVLPEVLGVVKDFLGEGRWLEAYAEHPYIIAEIDEFRVEFVPCFRVDPREGLVSATDRTPLHTDFVSQRLTSRMKDEVRLLKRFMKGIGVYGAELKVGGFSGYLCELLVLHLNSFDKVLERCVIWRKGEIFDILGESDPEALREQFREPLIVPDPVDAGRNVASAVSDNSFWTLTEAARAFLEKPKKIFFFSEEISVDVPVLLKDIRNRNTSLIFVVVIDGDAQVPDVLWGQLYKSEKAIFAFLEKNDFNVMKSAIWSDESSKHVFVFELESAFIPKAVRRMGPPVAMEESSKRFMETHASSMDTISGPWIEGQRWWVIIERSETDACKLLVSELQEGGANIGVSRGIAERIRREVDILLGDEIEEHLVPEFAVFLDRFLKGRPVWLD